MRKLALLLLIIVLFAPGVARANVPIGLSTVTDADDASDDMPIDIKFAQNHVFGGDHADRETKFAIESYEPFYAWDFGKLWEGDFYSLEFLVNNTRKHRGSDMSFTVYDDGDLGLRYRVTDYHRGTLPFNGDVPRPSDTTLAIFFPNDLIPVKDPDNPQYKWRVRSVRLDPTRFTVIDVDRAPNTGWVRQDGF